jgi:glycolate oxidase FAD binding subunit
MSDHAVEALQQVIRRAVAQHAPLRIRGGGTKDFYGERLAGDVLDVGRSPASSTTRRPSS